jgi:hypothetical protein
MEILMPIQFPQGSSIADVMDVAKNSSLIKFNYSTVDPDNQQPGDYVESITFRNTSAKVVTVSANLYDYDAKAGDNYVFWFYSINGRANKNNSGTEGMSFKVYGTTDDTALQDGDTIWWQLIAPEGSGFLSCD